jgi:hypothetical protein
MGESPAISSGDERLGRYLLAILGWPHADLVHGLRCAMAADQGLGPPIGLVLSVRDLHFVPVRLLALWHIDLSRGSDGGIVLEHKVKNATFEVKGHLQRLAGHFEGVGAHGCLQCPAPSARIVRPGLLVAAKDRKAFVVPLIAPAIVIVGRIVPQSAAQQIRL